MVQFCPYSACHLFNVAPKTRASSAQEKDVMVKHSHINSSLFHSCRGGGVNLHAPKWADYEEWVDLRTVNKDHLTPWEPLWDPSHLSRTRYRTRLAKFKKLIADDEGYPFHVFRADDKCLVGACNLTQVRRGSQQSAHIGYWVGEKYSRQGFARASVQAVLGFAFNDLGLHRVSAAVQADNTASIKLLETIGFQSEGTARGFLKINGQWADHIVYARLSSD
jgi:ribosomal-protein-alanine N-acetyltransferase